MKFFFARKQRRCGKNLPARCLCTMDKIMINPPALYVYGIYIYISISPAIYLEAYLDVWKVNLWWKLLVSRYINIYVCINIYIYVDVNSVTISSLWIRCMRLWCIKTETMPENYMISSMSAPPIHLLTLENGRTPLPPPVHFGSQQIRFHFYQPVLEPFLFVTVPLATSNLGSGNHVWLPVS